MDNFKNQPSFMEYSYAIYFLSKVKKKLKNHPVEYVNFQRILNEFQVKQQAIYKSNQSESNVVNIIKETKERIVELLSGNKELVSEFDYFLPIRGQKSSLENMQRKLIKEEEESILCYNTKVIRDVKEVLSIYDYNLFLKILNLYGKRIIEHREMVQLVKDVLRRNHPVILAQFLDAFDMKREPQPLYKKVEEARRKKDRASPSYVHLNKEKKIVSERREVLNENYISVPINSEDKFLTNSRNEYEERLLLFEDDLYELEFLLNMNESLIRKFEDFESRNMRAKDGGKHLTLTKAERGCLAKLYDSKAEMVLGMVDCRPEITVPVLKHRCILKKKEWTQLKKKLTEYWKKMNVDRWISSFFNLSVSRIDRFRAYIDEVWQTSCLKNAELYLDCYLNPISSIENDPNETQKSNIDNLLKKHEAFTLNSTLSKFPDFLTPPENLSKEQKNYALNFNLNVLEENHLILSTLVSLLEGLIKRKTEEMIFSHVKPKFTAKLFSTDEKTEEVFLSAEETLLKLFGELNKLVANGAKSFGNMSESWRLIYADLFEFKLPRFFDSCNWMKDGRNFNYQASELKINRVSKLASKDKEKRKHLGKHLTLKESDNPAKSRLLVGDKNWYLFLYRLSEALSCCEKLTKSLPNKQGKISTLIKSTVNLLDGKLSIKELNAANFDETVTDEETLETLLKFPSLLLAALTSFMRVINSEKSMRLFLNYQKYFRILQRTPASANSDPYHNSERRAYFKRLKEAYTQQSHSIVRDELIYMEYNIASGRLGVGIYAHNHSLGQNTNEGEVKNEPASKKLAQAESIDLT